MGTMAVMRDFGGTAYTINRAALVSQITTFLVLFDPPVKSCWIMLKNMLKKTLNSACTRTPGINKFLNMLMFFQVKPLAFHFYCINASIRLSWDVNRQRYLADSIYNRLTADVLSHFGQLEIVLYLHSVGVLVGTVFWEWCIFSV